MSELSVSPPPTVQEFSPDQLQDEILRHLNTRDIGKSIDASQIARALVGNDEKQWRLMMKPIRKAAVELAERGEILVIRKGKPVDPNNFKGVYRMRLP